METRFKVGDKIHANCFSDFSFSIDVEIVGISKYEHVAQHEDIFRKIFNSENADIIFDSVKQRTSLYYICIALSETTEYAIGDTLILTDELIKISGTYYLQDVINLELELGYERVTSGYETKEQLIMDLQKFFESRSVGYKIDIAKTQQQKNDEELVFLRNLVRSIKELESCVETVQQLKEIDSNSISSTIDNGITELTTTINDLVHNLTQVKE